MGKVINNLRRLWIPQRRKKLKYWRDYITLVIRILMSSALFYLPIFSYEVQIPLMSEELNP